MTYHKIYTSYFSNINNLLKHNFINLISVAGKCPNDFQFKQFKKLAPKYVWWKEWHDKHLSNEYYINKYLETVLNHLNPIEIYFKLTNNNTSDVVLLCWETPNLFCHRHLIANWLNESLKLNISNEIELK